MWLMFRIKLHNFKICLLCNDASTQGIYHSRQNYYNDWNYRKKPLTPLAANMEMMLPSNRKMMCAYVCVCVSLSQTEEEKGDITFCT